MTPRLPARLVLAALAWVPEARAAAAVREMVRRPGDLALAHPAATRRAGATLRAWLGAVATTEPPVATDALAGLRPTADEDRLLLAWCLARAGRPEEARRGLAEHEARRLVTAFGPRAPAQSIARRPLVERFDALLAPAPSGTIVDRAGRRDPADLAALRQARAVAGRRGDHRLLVALADHGDPRALDDFRQALFARDVDPGRGFTQRRLAADGIGALGLRAGVPLLAAALRDEQADFEGRPGAGCGIQYPVRANLLYALGEIGHASAIPLLVPYLADVTGSAFGGFYLPAMDALVRIGPAATDAVRRAIPTLGETGAANARGVLAALGTAP